MSDDYKEKLAKVHQIIDPISENDVVNEARRILDDYGNPILGKADLTIKSSEPVFTLEILLNRSFPDVEWIVDSLIPTQGLVALSGAPGNYKSWITEQIAISVASGEPLFGNFTTNQGSILIIDKENNLRLIKERFQELGAQPDLPIFFQNLESVDFLTDNPDSIELVCQVVREKNIKLVIIDSLIRSHKQDENSATGMAQVFEALRKIQNAGAAILFTHHHRKQAFFNRAGVSENLRGSSDILAAVDCHLAVDRIEDGIRVTQSKLRQKKSIKPFKIRLDPISESKNQVKFTFLGEVEEEKIKKDDAKEVILVLLKQQSFKRQELIEQLVNDNICSKRTAESALSELVKEEKIGHTDTKPYVYSLPLDDSANRNHIDTLRNAELNLSQTQSQYSEESEND